MSEGKRCLVCDLPLKDIGANPWEKGDIEGKDFGVTSKNNATQMCRRCRSLPNEAPQALINVMHAVRKAPDDATAAALFVEAVFITFRDHLHTRVSVSP